MSKSRLPTRAADCWQGGLVINPPFPLCDVSGGGGLVMAGGSAMLMLRPGAESWKMRQPPTEHGSIVAVAAEPKPPWRYAVAFEGCVTVYGLPNDQMLTLRPKGEEAVATHMAWANFKNDTVLYLRWSDGAIARVRFDLGSVEPLVVLPMDAIAADANGVLAMVAVRCAASDAHALMSKDGVRFEERPISAGAPQGTEPRVFLSVADTAIAYSVEGHGTHLSRGIDDDFVSCGLPGGPLSFQGSSADAGLFGVGHSKDVCAIHYLDARGVANPIVELGGYEVDAPKLSAIQWDATRHALWAASREAGLIRADEPKGKAGKERRLN